MATMAATAEVFTRKASGLVRVMSPYSAFIYNILTMGLIFPWTYLWAPGALPGGNMVWGILLAMLFQIPVALSIVWLSTALPRSGGDYVFQSRVLGGGLGFTAVMSGFVIWILQWVALSGWLLAYLGFAPLFLGLGATLGSSGLSNAGVWFTTGTGIIVTSIANAALSAGILVSGFKYYVRFQYVMFYGTLAAFAVMFVVLFTTPSPPELPRTSIRPRSTRCGMPGSTCARPSACWRRCSWPRSPGPPCSGQPTLQNRMARSRKLAHSATRRSSWSAR